MFSLPAGTAGLGAAAAPSASLKTPPPDAWSSAWSPQCEEAAWLEPKSALDTKPLLPPLASLAPPPRYCQPPPSSAPRPPGPLFPVPPPGSCLVSASDWFRLCLV